MYNRILIGELHDHVGAKVEIGGWVSVRRDHGKLIFLDIRDRSGKVQAVALPNHEGVVETAGTLRGEYVVSVTANVNKRPEKMVNADEQNGDIELEILSIETLVQAEELPFAEDATLNLDTLLDNRPLTIRRERERAIFKVQHEIIRAWREYLVQEEFVEFQAPKLVGGDAEGGAEVFKVGYFGGQDAYLATSPQLYKQIMVGAYERVFTTGEQFRAEPHATSRHLSEISMLDLEMGFINDHRDVMETVKNLMRHVTEKTQERAAHELAAFGASPVLAPETFPIFTLKEAQELIKEKTGSDKVGTPDLDPEDERWLSEYAATESGSDFVFVTHYPYSKRPFYTRKDPNDPSLTLSFDLLFRGVEICSGGQRVHEAPLLEAQMRERGLDPANFSFYLQAFRYGMPPHGGIGMGLGRLTQKFLSLANVREATAFPRDMNRIDTLLKTDTTN